MMRQVKGNHTEVQEWMDVVGRRLGVLERAVRQAAERADQAWEGVQLLRATAAQAPAAASLRLPMADEPRSLGAQLDADNSDGEQATARQQRVEDRRSHMRAVAAELGAVRTTASSDSDSAASSPRGAQQEGEGAVGGSTGDEASSTRRVRIALP